VPRIKSWIDDGLDWFGQQFRPDRNPQPLSPDAEKYDDRWKYYYLYGVERVGGLLQESLFGEHDWYKEGAAFLLKAQRPNGSFGGNEKDEDIANTCFALLFLKRATVKTERLATIEEQLTSDVVLRVDGNGPLHLSIQRFSSKVVERCSWPPGGIANLRIKSVEYFAGNQSVAKVEGSDSEPIMAQRFGCDATPEEGEKQLAAAVTFVLPDHQLELIESNKVARYVLPPPPPPVVRFLEDAPQNLLRADQVRDVAASSFFGPGYEAVNAVNGVYSDCWLCKEDDAQPWISFRVSKDGVVANRIRLQCATRGRLDPDQFARPSEISIMINEKVRLKHKLEAPENETELIEIPRTRITALEIRILSRTPGVAQKGATGFQEIALESQNRATRASK